jgi:hypothetical protein
MLTGILMLPVGIELFHSCDAHLQEYHFNDSRDHLHVKEVPCDLCEVVIHMPYLSPEITDYKTLDHLTFKLDTHQYLGRLYPAKWSLSPLRAPPHLG